MANLSFAGESQAEGFAGGLKEPSNCRRERIHLMGLTTQGTPTRNPEEIFSYTAFQRPIQRGRPNGSARRRTCRRNGTDAGVLFEKRPRRRIYSEHALFLWPWPACVPCPSLGVSQHVARPGAPAR